MRTRNFLTIVLAIAMMIAAPLSAQVNVVWDGSNDANWATAANWVGDALPTTIDDVTFNDVGLAGVGLEIDMQAADVDVANMFISQSADGYNFTATGAGSLLVNDLTHSASGVNTIATDLFTTGAINVDAGRLVIPGNANGIDGAVNVNAGGVLEARPFSLGVATITLNGGTGSFSVGGGGVLNSPLNYGFNTPGAAGLTGWNIVTGPGNNVVFAGDANPCNDGEAPEGANYISTHKGSDNHTGIIRSDPFVIGDQGGGEQISLQVGGGGGGVPVGVNGDNPAANWIGVSLEKYIDGTGAWEVVEQAPHNFQWNSSTVTWDTTGYVGETMRMGIYDTGGGGWGFVTVDDIRISSVQTLDVDTPGNLVMTDNDVEVTAGSTLEVIVDTPSSASFGALTLTGGTLTIENTGTGTSFTALAPIPSDAVTGIISQKPVTLNGALAIGDRADVTLDAPLTITGGITLNDDGDGDSIAAATIRVPSGTMAWPGTFNQAGVDTQLTQAGPGTLQLHDLGAAAADQSAFTVRNGGTIEFSGATPMGGSTEDINLEGGTIRIEGEPVAGFDNGLIHYGFHRNDDGALMNLNNNGGMMGGTPMDPTSVTGYYGQALLIDGPGDRGLDFNNDADWRYDGAINQNDNISNLIFGYLSVNESGNWTMRQTDNDDVGAFWLDKDQDGVFEDTGDEGAERLGWEDTGTKTVSLTNGEKYMVAFIHREGGGGSAMGMEFSSPSISNRFIKPGEAAQDGLWLHETLVVGGIDLSDTDVVVDAPGAAGSRLELVSDLTAAFGNLTLNSGVLTVDGTDGGTTFNTVTVADGADTGLISAKPLGITSGGLTVMNSGASGSQNFTLGGSFAIPGVLSLGNNAKVTAGAGSVTAPTLALEAGVPTSNTVALGTDGLLTVGVYDDGGQARVISLQPDGAATNGKLRFGSAGAAGTVVANNSTFNVAANTTLEGMDNAGAPLGAAGAQMLNLDGGTALFSRGGKVYMPSGLAAHFDAGAGVTVDGGGVVQNWADQSGNGFDATPHVGAPTLAANAINGLPAVEFSTAGGNDALGVDHDLFAKEMYFVFRNSDSLFIHNSLFGKQAGGRGSTFIFDNNATTLHSNRYPESWARDGVAGSGWNLAQNAPIDQYMLLKVVVNDEDLAAEPYYSSGVDSISRGADWLISEIMAFDGKLSAAEETAVGAYLANKYKRRRGNRGGRLSGQ